MSFVIFLFFYSFLLAHVLPLPPPLSSLFRLFSGGTFGGGIFFLGRVLDFGTSLWGR